MNDFTPSKYQQAIFDWIAGDHRALVVEALAGSGKTTTLVKALDLIPEDKTVLFMAFNRHIADELKTRVPENVLAETYHTVGFTALKEQYPDTKLEKNKNKLIFDSHFPDHKTYYSSVNKLIGLMKANLTPLENQKEIEEICYRYDIDVMDDPEFVIKLAQFVIQKSAEMTQTIDFDDMCWIPVVNNIPMQQYDYIFIDEAQDTNKSQIQLALKCAKPDSRIIAVGDRFQSIYGFRGADVDAIPNLIEALKADILPLSITYRCPKSHVRQCNKLFPDIKIEAALDAKEGEIIHARSLEFYNTVSQGDMVLCRTNAPLIAPAFQLIRDGKKVTIRGKDIASNLERLLNRAKIYSLNDLYGEKFSTFIASEYQKLDAKKQIMAAENLIDKRDTLIAIARECHDIYELRAKLGTLFSDDIPDIVFSTVHKAKGLESNVVWIINPSLMPHRMAKASWERQQEQNIMYVAYTRAKNTIYYVEM